MIIGAFRAGDRIKVICTGHLGVGQKIFGYGRVANVITRCTTCEPPKPVYQVILTMGDHKGEYEICESILESWDGNIQ